MLGLADLGGIMMIKGILATTGVPGREKVLKSSVSRFFTKMSEFVMIIGIVFAIKMSLRGSYFTIMPVPNQ